MGKTKRKQKRIKYVRAQHAIAGFMLAFLSLKRIEWERVNGKCEKERMRKRVYVDCVRSTHAIWNSFSVSFLVFVHRLLQWRPRERCCYSFLAVCCISFHIGRFSWIYFASWISLPLVRDLFVRHCSGRIAAHTLFII